jgi:GNAT superfamily N-acetyltransferase
MIRPFDWRDFALVRRLSEQGISFDSEAALTRGSHTLQSAVLSFLAPGVGLPTYICKNDEPTADAFGQIRFRAGEENAHLTFVAPGYNNTGVWETLLEHLCLEAAGRNAHNLVAEVDEHSPEFDALRQFGFAVYTRQHLYRREKPQPPVTAIVQPRLRPQTGLDSIGIQSLYANIVPRLIQQVEPPPNRYGHGFVLEEESEIVAFFDVSRGPLGIWIQPYLHPSISDHANILIADLLCRFTDHDPVPIYVCVRSHQDWLRTPLIDLEFSPWADQAVMVKRLAVRIGEPEFKPLPAIQGVTAK